jgi:hypothetical protein
VADQKITQLNQLLAADAQATVDVLPIADVSTAETKKITLADVVTAGIASISNNTIAGAKLQNDSVTATQIAANAVGTSELVNSSVTIAKINAGAVTADKVASNTLTAAQIAPNAIGASELADLSVDSAAIATNAVITAKIANDAVTNDKLALLSVGTSELIDNSVTNAKMADAAVGTAELINNAVTNDKMADSSVGTAELIDDAVTTPKIAAGAVDTTAVANTAITTAKLADDAVTAAKLANASVDTAAVIDASITAAKLAVDAVTNAKIAAAAVGTAELIDDAVTNAKVASDAINTAEIVNGAVTTAKLADAAVTTAKIADSAVGTNQLAALSVTGAKIANDTITATQIAPNAIGASELADLSVDAPAIANNAVTTAKISDGAVTTSKFAAGAVDSTALGTNAVTTAKITDGTVTAAKLANDLDGSEFLAQSANVVLAGPASGASAVPTFRALTATDIPLLGNANLPVATGSVRGTVIVGTGLSADGSGTLSISNTVVGATATKVTFNSNGLITAGSNLVAADIPSLDASKITTGTFDSALIASDAITGAKLADSSTTKFGGSVDTGGIVTFPTADFKGQYFYDEINQDLYIWSGSAWLPVTIISGELIFAGTYDASVNQIGTVTAAGAAVGLSVGALLPNASSTNNRYYLVVSDSGTGTGNAPNEALAPPDMILSNGVNWELIDVSSGIGGQIATNVSFSPYGNLLATNVQLAIQELEDEKLAKAGGTVTGEVIFGTTASLVFEGSTADDYETTLAVTDPTADRTITLPDQTGTVLVSGNASIVNADISASAEIAVSKLANGTARQLLQTASGGTDVEWASNIDIPGTLDVTSTATFDSTVAIGAGNLNYSDGTY